MSNDGPNISDEGMTGTNHFKKRRLERMQLEEQIKQLESDVDIKEYAREELEEIYADRFPADDPPDCITRYESEATLRNLTHSVHRLHTGSMQPDRTDREREEVVEHVVSDSIVDESKAIIDVMATYGQLAEPYLAGLTSHGVHPDIRVYATQALAELRSDKDESKSLTAVLRDWWQGE